MSNHPSTNTTLIVGLSGPSSSGKTTLARLLRQIFDISSSNTALSRSIRLFILHEDDFYKTDKLIPRQKFSSRKFGERELEDWDCVESLDLPLLKSTLTHVKQHGSLPPDMHSKEDQNTIGESGVPDEVVAEYHQKLLQWLAELPTLTVSATSASPSSNLVICLLDGFLLYPDPKSAESSLERELFDILRPLLSVKLFVLGTRELTIERRSKRTGYVTLEGFWADPPGYVQDVVWPNYRRDHAWLFQGKGDEEKEDVADAVDHAKVNRDTAADASILVSPGNGETHLKEILPWAIERLKEAVGREIIGREMRSLMEGIVAS